MICYCRKVLPTVEPGYMAPLLPTEAPQSPEKWQDVMADIERVIMPGVSNEELFLKKQHTNIRCRVKNNNLKHFFVSTGDSLA